MKTVIEIQGAWWGQTIQPTLPTGGPTTVERSGILTSETSQTGPASVERSGILISETSHTGPATIERSGIGVNLNSSGQSVWTQEQERMRDLTYYRGIGTYGT
jgi:hypothetical protein